MSRVHYLEGEYDQLVINETIDGLFSSYRIDRNSLPKGFFLYEIRWDDSLSSLAEPNSRKTVTGSFSVIAIFKNGNGGMCFFLKFKR